MLPHHRIFVYTEDRTELSDFFLYVGQVLFTCLPAGNLRGKVEGRVVRPEVDLSAVHSGSAEITHRWPAVLPEAQDYYRASCLILAEEGADRITDDDEGLLVLIRLHVDSGPVSGTVPDVDLSASHGVAAGI